MAKTDDDDNVFEDVVEEEVEEEAIEETPPPSTPESDYYATWTPEIVDDYPPEVSEFNIIGYNSDGVEFGPVKVLAPDLGKAGVVAGMVGSVRRV